MKMNKDKKTESQSSVTKTKSWEKVKINKKQIKLRKYNIMQKSTVRTGVLKL